MCQAPRKRGKGLTPGDAPFPSNDASTEKAAVEVPEKEGGDPRDWEMKQGFVGSGDGRVVGGRTGTSLARGQDGPEEQEQPGAGEQKVEAGG